MEKYYEVNKKRWNELVTIHAKSKEYDLEGFISGKNSLHSIELEALGDVRGKSLLHLQCHFGLDTISWARLGARVTGVDFSDSAIELAQNIANRVGVKAEFICSNVFELSEVLKKQYDIVFTSYGVLMWLHDIDDWGKIVARYLKPGGVFFIAEFHPFAWVFDDNGEELKIKYSYWHSNEPIYWEENGSYADPDAKVENKGDYEWAHPISDVVNALINAGLILKEFKEYPFSVDASNPPGLVKCEDGYSRFKDKSIDIPLLYSIKAVKP
jgi:2-polyprenyl-3-methyl-5-hydroxy-6-metoxy-1,4-benzoquinol methylase